MGSCDCIGDLALDLCQQSFVLGRNSLTLPVPLDMKPRKKQQIPTASHVNCDRLVLGRYSITCLKEPANGCRAGLEYAGGFEKVSKES